MTPIELSEWRAFRSALRAEQRRDPKATHETHLRRARKLFDRVMAKRKRRQSED